MATLTIEFQLDEELAVAYQQALPKEKVALKKLVEGFLNKILRKKEVEDFLQLTQDIGKEAEANGLTEAIIDDILAKS